MGVCHSNDMATFPSSVVTFASGQMAGGPELQDLHRISLGCASICLQICLGRLWDVLMIPVGCAGDFFELPYDLFMAALDCFTVCLGFLWNLLRISF